MVQTTITQFVKCSTHFNTIYTFLFNYIEKNTQVKIYKLYLTAFPFSFSTFSSITLLASCTLKYKTSCSFKISYQLDHTLCPK